MIEHVCDTAGHLLKPRVSLEKMVDQTTPQIAGDGSRIVQVSCLDTVLLAHCLLACLLTSPDLLDFASDSPVHTLAGDTSLLAAPAIQPVGMRVVSCKTRLRYAASWCMF